MGDIFTSDGIRADPNKIQAIVDMSAPEIKKELRSFLGIVNFIAYFTSNLSQLTLSLRSLLKHQTVWIWDQVHDVAFEKLKSMLTSSEVLSYFDPNKHSTLQVDASMKGLGVCLLQENKPTCCISIACTYKCRTKLLQH